MRQAHRVAAVALAAFAVVAGLQQEAYAHASVLSTFPADGALLDSNPGTIEIAFNETVEVPEGSIRLVRSGGATEPLTHTLREEVSGTLLEAGTPNMPAGWYAISWRAISADGHPVGGAFSFRVGQTDQTLAEAGLSISDPAGPYLAASHPIRALGYLATLLAVGLLGALWASSGPRAREELPKVAETLRRGALIAAGTGIAAIALGVVNSALILNGGSFDRIGPVTQLILRSTAGSGYMIRMSGMLAMCTAVLLLADRQTRKAGWLIGAAGAYGIMHGYAVAGHAALVPQEALASVSLVVHLSAGALWLGGIPGVLLTLSSRPRPSLAATAEIVDRYSRIATLAVVGVLVFGTATAVTMVETVTDLFTTAYGLGMLAKILIVLILAGVGAYNHYVLVPALRKRAGVQQSETAKGEEERPGADETSEDADRPSVSMDEPDRMMRSSLSIETVGLVAVVIATAFLTSSGAPAAGWSDGIAHLGHRHGASDGGLSPRLGQALESLEPQISYVAVGSGEARISFAPGLTGRENLVRIEVTDASGERTPVREASLTLDHPTSGIEGLERAMEQRSDGDLRLRTYDFGLPGEWLAEAYVVLPNGAVEIFEFTVTLREGE